MKMAKKILLIIGTRADAIKMAPVIEAFRNDRNFEPIVLATSQHREMLDQVLDSFGLAVDIDLDIMRPNQTLADISIRSIEGMERLFSKEKIEMTFVQGDTTTSFIGGLVSFYHSIPVAHIEAGLRTHDLSRPFPEEANRRLLDAISSILFPPTETAKMNLLAENLPEKSMFVTGNTAIDSLFWVIEKKNNVSDKELNEIIHDKKKRLIVVTAHRRESFGEPFKRLINALRRIAIGHPDVVLVYPVHLNPNVDKPVRASLSDVPNIKLVPPLNYPDFALLMSSCYFILTDSGGIQEEAPALGKPVIVLRDVTERPEGIEAGVAKLAGTDENMIYSLACELLADPEKYEKMSKHAFLYGDGKASERILNFTKKFLGISAKEPSPFVPFIEERD